MNQDLFKGNKLYDFNIVEGVVKETNMWSESHVSGGGGSTTVIAGWGRGSTKKVKTTVHNHLEFWVATEDGKERFYKVDANKVKVRPDQNVRIVEMNYHGDRESRAVYVQNNTQEIIYKAQGAWGVMMDGRPKLSYIMLFSALISPLFFWAPLYWIYMVWLLPYSFYKVSKISARLKRLKSYLIGESHSKKQIGDMSRALPA